jgi:hypothetical protein
MKPKSGRPLLPQMPTKLSTRWRCHDVIRCA